MVGREERRYCRGLGSWQYILEVELAGPAGELGLEGGRTEENQSTVCVCVFLMRWGNQEWSKLGNSILKCLSGVSREVGSKHRNLEY